MLRALSLLALVLALAVGLWLFTRKASDDVQLVRTWETEPQSAAPPASLEWWEAQRFYSRLAALVLEPQPAPQELKVIAQKAAGWAAGSRPGSPEYRVAVALRAACVALAQAGPEPNHPQRQKARSELAIVRSVLAGESPGSVTHGIQDQLKNVQVERSEQMQKALEEN